MCGRSHVGDALAIPEPHRPSTRAASGRTRDGRPQRDQRVARGRIGRGTSRPSRCSRGDVEEPPQILLGLGPAFDRQKIDQLDEAGACIHCWHAHGTNELAKPGMKRSSPIRSNGPLGMSRTPVASTTIAAGPPHGEALVPFEHIVGDHTVVGRAPGHHGRHPRALSSGNRPATRGENQHDRDASSALGQRAGSSGCRIVSGGCHMSDVF